jgi:hypothetical protein
VQIRHTNGMNLMLCRFRGRTARAVSCPGIRTVVGVGIGPHMVHNRESASWTAVEHGIEITEDQQQRKNYSGNWRPALRPR